MKKKIMVMIGILVLTLVTLTGCAEVTTTNTKQDIENTLNIGNKLVENQATPTDINYSLERYNLIRRTYWVNGQRERANTLVCEVEKPLGYIALFLENGACAGKFIVDGKITSLNSYLTPDSEYYELVYVGAYSRENKWLPDVDGSYGSNDNGIFFFSVKYVIGAPAESMKDFGARVLLPKLLAKARAEIKQLKADIAALKSAK